MNPVDPTKPLEVEPQFIDIKKEDIADGIEFKENTETPDKEEDDDLNEKQELFCKLYATDREFFGNGVQTYIEVYEPDTKKPNWYKTACSSASQILSNIKVAKRINELLSGEGLNDQNVDKQLLFLINQFDDKNAKIAAIREYNKLKSRITEKIDATTLGEKIEVKTIYIDTRPREEASK